jgi:hypothetical protein
VTYPEPPDPNDPKQAWHDGFAMGLFVALTVVIALSLLGRLIAG